jgi:hypothetical protein
MNSAIQASRCDICSLGFMEYCDSCADQQSEGSDSRFCALLGA